MDFQYIAYTSDRKLVKGRLSATDEGAATSLLNYGGYQLVSLKAKNPFFNMGSIAGRFSRIKSREIIMFSRQLALLLESGTDIVTSLELLQDQATNRGLKAIIGQVASDIRGGTSLSTALSKHPQAFPEIYHRTIAAGEQGGNMEVVLRQMADYLERGYNTEKKIKGALSYPIMLAAVALVVVAIMIAFVMPTFVDLYASFETELPLATQFLIDASDWLIKYGLYLLLALVAVVVVSFIYTRTPTGGYQWDKLQLRLPVVGYSTIVWRLGHRPASRAGRSNRSWQSSLMCTRNPSWLSTAMANCISLLWPLCYGSANRSRLRWLSTQWRQSSRRSNQATRQLRALPR